MTSPIDPYLGTPVPGLGEKLKEPGAGWRNDLIESAHLKAANPRERDDGTDFTPGTHPADNKAWLDDMHRAPTEAAPCVSCTHPTTRTTVLDVYQQRGRNWALRAVHECEGCYRRRMIQRLTQRLTAPDVDPEARERLVAQLAEIAALAQSEGGGCGSS